MAPTTRQRSPWLRALTCLSTMPSTPQEMPRLSFLGHSAVEYAVGLAERCGVGGLVLFHHDPWRTDEEIDQMVSKYDGAGVPIIAAYDGMVLDLP